MAHRTVPMVLLSCLLAGLVLVTGAPVSAAGPPTFVRRMNACYPTNDIRCFQISVDGLGVGTNDEVYASSGRTTRRVKRMSPTGDMLSFWGPSGTGWEFEYFGGGIAITGNGDVLRVDDYRIHRFTSTGAWKATYPGAFPDHQQAIAVAPGGTIYVSIPGAILRFDSDGHYLDRWAVDLGRGATYGLAVGDGGDVYVSDFTHDKILRFSSAGIFEKEWGSTGTGNGELKTPLGLAVGPDGDVYVADSGNHRVQRFTKDGAFVTKWGSQGTGPGQFPGGPIAIAVGASGDIVVGDDGVGIHQFRSVTAAQPDGRVRLGTSGAFKGDDVYNTTGANQSRTGSAKPGKTVTFTLSIQNDGRAKDRFKLKGGASTSAFGVTYKSGTTNITAAVTAGTWKTGSLAPGAAQLITVTVAVKPGAAAGAKLTALLTLTSVADAAQKDAVKLITKRS